MCVARGRSSSDYDHKDESSLPHFDARIVGRLLRLRDPIATLAPPVPALSFRLLSLVLGVTPLEFPILLRRLARLFPCDSRNRLINPGTTLGCPREAELHLRREFRPSHHKVTDVRLKLLVWFAEALDRRPCLG